MVVVPMRKVSLLLLVAKSADCVFIILYLVMYSGAGEGISHTFIDLLAGFCRLWLLPVILGKHPHSFGRVPNGQCNDFFALVDDLFHLESVVAGKCAIASLLNVTFVCRNPDERSRI